MLVQLSPWETSRTSIRLPTSSRRRKRGSKENNEDGFITSFAASMITMASKSSLSRMKAHSPEFANCLPLVTITADHHITVLGKSVTNKEGAPSHHEFSSLRYSSRPGEAGSFFATSPKGASSANDLPRIPAILDTKNDRVYAFQQGNKRLTCWNSWKGGGPDEKSALKIQLQYPVTSMSLLPMNKGIVYGSCQNGFIYVARIINGTFSVEYLEVNQPDHCVQIGTFAEIDLEQAKGSGRKRKMSDAEGNSHVKFYQVFCDGKCVKIVRNSVTLSTSNSDRLIKTGSLIQNTSSIDLIGKSSLKLGDEYNLTRADLLVSSAGTAPKISIIYSVSTNSKDDKANRDAQVPRATFCAPIDLTSGDVSSSPVILPSQSKQFGLVTESVLAAATNETIYLYDLTTGAVLQSISMQRITSDMVDDVDWKLETNAKHGTICVFYPKDNSLHFAVSTASLDERKGSLGSTKLKSSSKLACSLLARSNGISQTAPIHFNNMRTTGTKKVDNGVLTIIQYDEMVKKVLISIEDTLRSILSQKGGLPPKSSFRDAFYTAITTLVDYQDDPNQDEPPSNGEIRTPTKKLKNGKLNGGCNPSSPKKSSRIKGGRIPSCIPQSFIDRSIEITMSAFARNEGGTKALDKLKLDTRHVLKELVESKRVSARLHFEGVHGLQETGKKHPMRKALSFLDSSADSSPLSSLQLILKMINNCPDLSERQLVIMLDYMMRYARADDIVNIVKYKDAQPLPKELLLATGDKKKTILAGVKVVLQMVVSYTECNEAMLRAALVDELSSSAEAVILARLLPDLLIATPDSNRSDHFVRSVCQWIGALSEGFRDDLCWARTLTGENYLSYLHNSVAETTKVSEQIMSLKDSIGVAEMIKKCKIPFSKQVHSDMAEELLGYSIDRILF